jgi:P-type E1-E2 ATPase
VSERLHALSKLIRITVLTADTFGTARSELAGLPVELKTISSALDKEAAVKQSGPDNVAAIGNGVNDVAMVRDAALGIAVIGPEGAAGELILVADVVVRDILDGLDLLLTPRRFKATLRA